MIAVFLISCSTMVSIAAGLSYGSSPFPTIQKGELMAIIECLVNHPRYHLCKDFALCERNMPEHINLVYERCQRKLIGGGLQGCDPYQPRFVSTEIPPMMFDCITDNAKELKSEERKQMAEFEKCARGLWNKYCLKSRQD